MEQKKTSTLSNGLIWFGAGVSIAEILTGTYFGELGFKKGILAIFIGHIIGCVLFSLVIQLFIQVNGYGAWLYEYL